MVDDRRVQRREDLLHGQEGGAADNESDENDIIYIYIYMK